MIRSMTGFGVAEGVLSGSSFRVELRSLNNRYFEFSSRLSSLLISCEPDIKRLVQKVIKRGKVSCAFILSETEGMERKVYLDEEKVRFYVRALKAVGKKYNVAGTVTLSDIIALPNIFVAESKDISLATIKKAVLPVVEEALHRLVTMREREGALIVKDIKMRIAHIKKITAQIKQLAKTEPATYKKRLEKRLETLNAKASCEPARIAQEVALFADKCDVTEEIVRLESHITHFSESLNTSGEKGKRLDFITQEMHRETNTIGSKTSHADIGKHVISIKLELEKIREQLNNVE